MPKILIKKEFVKLPSNALVYEILHLKPLRYAKAILKNEIEKLEKFSGLPVDVNEPCYKCSKNFGKKYYLFTVDKDRKPIFYDPTIEQENLANGVTQNSKTKLKKACSFCRACIDEAGIQANKVWFCSDCDSAYVKKKNNTTCDDCLSDNKLIKRILNTISKTGVKGNTNKFFEKLAKLSESESF